MDGIGSDREREISRGFQRGEAWAFEAAARTYLKSMVHFVSHLNHNRDRAVDLVQEAFFLACRAHHQVDPNRPLGPWLFQIARNMAYKEHNRLKRQPVVSMDEPNQSGNSYDPPSDTPDPRSKTEEREVMGVIKKLVDRIKPKYRDVLILRIMEGLPSEQVSRLLKIPVPTVNTRTHRALQHLRKLAQIEGVREEEWFS